MPPRPSFQSLGSTVGKRLFGTSSGTVISRKIQTLDKDKLRAALKAQGVRGGMTAKKIAAALTGKASSGSIRHLGGTIKALQGMGVAIEQDANMGKIMAESTRRAVQDEQVKATGSLRPNVTSLGTNASMGSRVAAARLEREGGETSGRPLEEARSIKEIRETLRALEIRDPKLPRPGYGRVPQRSKPPEDPYDVNAVGPF